MRPRQHYDRVMIFDYDGVITDGNPFAVQSMRRALQMVLSENGYGYSEEEFLQAMSDTSGTTEEIFIRKYLEPLHVELSELWFLLDEYISYRMRILHEYNEKMGLHKSDDGYICPDFIELMRRLKKSDREEGIRTYYAIATGNPRLVMEERLPEEVRAMVDVVKGGDSGRNRKDIVQSLLSSLLVEGVISSSETMFFYVDDSPRAVLNVADRDPTPPQRHWFDIYPVHIDRKNDPSLHILDLERQGLAFCVKDLRDSSLMSFLNPRFHRPIEGNHTLPRSSRR